jgi:hypothetical protein
MLLRRPSTARPRFAKTKDSIARLYDCAPWRKFKAQVLRNNPQCQRLINGEQCTQPAIVAHHILSPRVEPKKFLDWQNVLCVCASHHPNTTGEPVNSGNRYALTYSMFRETVDPNELIAQVSPSGKQRLSTADGRPLSTIPAPTLNDTDYLAMFKPIA